MARAHNVDARLAQRKISILRAPPHASIRKEFRPRTAGRGVSGETAIRSSASVRTEASGMHKLDLVAPASPLCALGRLRLRLWSSSAHATYSGDFRNVLETSREGPG